MFETIHIRCLEVKDEPIIAIVHLWALHMERWRLSEMNENSEEQCRLLVLHSLNMLLNDASQSSITIVDYPKNELNIEWIDDTFNEKPLASRHSKVHSFRVKLMQKDSTILVTTTRLNWTHLPMFRLEKYALLSGLSRFIVKLDNEPTPALLRLTKTELDRELYYDKARIRCYGENTTVSPEFDVLLWTKMKKTIWITETTLANIAMEINGEYVTPCLEVGALAGVQRAQYFQKRHLGSNVVFTECNIALTDLHWEEVNENQLRSTDCLIAFNSLRGVYLIQIVTEKDFLKNLINEN